MVKTLSGVTNFTVSDTLKVKKVSANNSLGTLGQVLTTNGSATYWATPVAEVAVNTAAQYVWTNTHIFNANVTVNAALIANGSSGTAGQVLHSNGTAIYWAADDVNVNTTYDLLAVANTETNKGIIRLKDVNNANDDVYVTGAGGVVVSSNDSHIVITGQSGDITGVSAGDGLTGNTASGEATIAVLPNTGIIANATGTYVNAAYIATIASNTSNFANLATYVSTATTTNTFNIGTSTYFLANGNVGIGNSSPSAPFTVQKAGSVSTIITKFVTEITGTAGSLFDYEHYNSLDGNGSAQIRFNRANGTMAAPTIIGADRVTGRLGSRGYDGTAFYDNALIRMAIDGAPGTGSMPGRFEIWTTPSGSTTLVERMRVTSTGNVGIGNTAPADKFSVNGTSYFGANVTLTAALIANGGAGSAGQVLHSNGSATYWAADDNENTTYDLLTVANTEANKAIIRLQDSGNANDDVFIIGANGITTSSNSSGAYAYVVGGNTVTINSTGVHVNSSLSITDLTLSGNLTVSGNVTVIGANTLAIVDNFIYLNANNTTQNIDLGFAGNYNDGTYRHAGFFRDASDGYWKVFDGYAPEPDANVNIDTTNTTFNIANFWAGAIRLGNTTVYSTINSTAFSGTSNTSNFANVATYVSTATTTNTFTVGTATYFVANGNVGVGNSTPSSKMHLQGATAGDSGSSNGAGSVLFVKQDTTWSGNQPWALYVSGYTYLNGFRINAADGIRALYKVDSGGQLGFATNGDDPITFTQSVSTERMRIAAGGNIGIGTSAPSEKLQVQGNALITSNNFVGPNTAFGIQIHRLNDINYIRSNGGNGTAELQIGSENNSTTKVYAHNGGVWLQPGPWHGSNDYRFTAATFTKQLRDSVNAATDHNKIDYTYTNNVAGNISSKIVYSINEKGNWVNYLTAESVTGSVGIGTTTPTGKLHVNLIGDTPNPVLNVVRGNNSGGGAGNDEIGINVNIPATYNNANTVYGVKVFTKHNLGGNHYGGHFVTDGGPYSTGIALYAKTTHTDTNGPGFQPAILADAYSTIGVSNTGYAVAIQANTSNYAKNINLLLSSAYTGTDNQTAVSITRNGSVVGSIITNTAATSYLTSTVSGMFGVDSNIIAFNTNSSERMRIAANGNVGIGTTTPAYILDVNGIAKSTGLVVGTEVGNYVKNSAHRAQIIATGSQTPLMMTGGSASFEFWKDTSASAAFAIGMAVPGSGAANDIIFSTYAGSWNERVRITNGGNVGIGTNSPSQRLTVANGQILVGPGDNLNSYINFYSTSYRVGASSGLEVQTATNDVIRFIRGTSETARISSVGNFGIGTSSPSSRLHIAGDFSLRSDIGNGDHDIIFGTSQVWNNPIAARIRGSLEGSSGGYAAGSLRFFTSVANSTAEVERVRINSLGNVGIGTTSPQAILDLGNGTSGRAITWGGDSGVNRYASIFTPYSASGLVIATGFHGNTTASDSYVSSYTGTYAASGIRFNFGTGDMQFFTDSSTAKTAGNGFAPTERMRVAANGNVGIATSTPGFKLEIGGTAYASNDFRAPIFYDSANTSFYVDPAGASNLSAANIGTIGWNSIIPQFGQRGIFVNELTDFLYQADKRFTVTNGSGVYFDGDFGSNVAIPVNTTRVININVAGQSGVPAIGITYPSGYFYVSFYHTYNAYSSITLRTKHNGVWITAPAPVNITATNGMKVLQFNVSGSNYLTDFELTIVTDATNEVWVSSLNYVSTRWTQELELPFVSKHYNYNYLFGNFGVKTNSNVINNLLSGTGNSYLAANTGNVGIANTSPTHRLSVNGTSYFQANVILNAALLANSSAGTAGQVLKTSGTGVYWAADTDTNTTYDLLAIANTTTNQGIVRLKDSSNANDDVQFTGANGIVVSSNATHVLITGQINTDINTTYDLLAIPNTAANEGRFRLKDSSNANDDVLVTGTGAAVVSSNSTHVIINATDTNTTYDMLAVPNTAANEGRVRLKDSSNANDDVLYTGTGGATVSSNSTHVIINAPVDTNTTYDLLHIANTEANKAIVRLSASTLANDDVFFIGANGINTISNSSGVHAWAIGSSTVTVNTTGIHVNPVLSITNLTVSGNLSVLGDTVTLNVASVAIEDSLIEYARNQNDTTTFTDALDIGFYGSYGNTANSWSTGLFRDQSDSGIWKLFQSNGAVTNTTIDTANSSLFRLAPLEAASFGTTEAGYGSATGGAIANATTIAVGNSTVNTAVSFNRVEINQGSVNNNSSTYGFRVLGNANDAIGYSGYEFGLLNSTANTTGFLRLARTAATAYLGMELQSQSRDGFRILTGASSPVEALRVNASGNVGVGSSSPVAKLEVKAATDNQDPIFQITEYRVGGAPLAKIYESGDAGVMTIGYYGLTASRAIINGGASAGASSLQLYSGANSNVLVTSSGSSYFNGGSVGIGTSNPERTLDVNGTVLIRSENSNALSTRFIAGKQSPGTGAGSLYLQYGIADFVQIGNGTTQSNFYVANGNVGIGTTNPQAALDLGAATNGRAITWGSDGAGRYASIFAPYSASGIVLAGGFHGNTTSDSYVSSHTGSYYANAIRINSFGSQGIQFFTDAIAAKTAGAAFVPTERMRIDNAGNLLVGGISTVSPFTLNKGIYLQSSTNNDIIGYSLYIDDSNNSRRASMFLDDTNGLFGWDVTASTGVPSYVWRTATTERMRITSAGDVGIGTAAPTVISGAPTLSLNSTTANTSGIVVFQNSGTQKGRIGLLSGFLTLQDIDSPGGISIDEQAARPITFKTNATDRMIINSAGNVGIGNNTPAATFHVQGTSLFRTGGAAVTLDSGAATDARMEFKYNGTRTGLIAVDNAVFSVVANSAATLLLGSNNAERMRIVSNGHIGIRTSAPPTIFTINPKVIDDGTVTYDSNTVYITHQTPTSTTTLNDPKPVLLLARQGTGGQAYGAAAEFNLSRYENAGTSSVGSRTRLDIRLAHDTFIAANTTVMTMRSDGNVGIGTVTPGVKLDINGDTRIANGSSLYWYNYNSTTNGPRIVGSNDNLTIESGPVGSARGALNLISHNNTSLQTDNGSLSLSASQTGTSLAYINFSTAGSERMRIANNGNVGIGNIDPLYKLHINNVVTVGTPASILTNAQPIVYLDNGSGVGGSVVIKSHSPGNGNQIGAIKFAASPDFSNYSWAGMAGLADTNSAASALAFYTADSNSQATASGASTERMRVTINGNFLVGLTASTDTSASGGHFAGPLLVGGYLNAHQTSRAVLQYFTNEVSLRAYGATAGAGYITLRTGGGGNSADAERMRVAANGNIGIGTTAPLGSLDIKSKGNSYLNGLNLVDNSNAAKTSFVHTSGSFWVGIANNASGADAANEFEQRIRIYEPTANTAAPILQLGDPDITILQNGSVGIGTAAPSEKLEVYGSGVDTSIIVNNVGNSRGGISGLGNQRLAFTSTASTDDLVFGYSGSPITSAGFVERMRIDNGTGNVGIGVTNPQSILDVLTPNNGYASFARGLSVGGWTGIHFGYREGNALYRKSAIVFERTDNSGGGGNAAGKVHILNGPAVGSGSATLADSRLTIDELGKVGIGTSAPGYKLEVVGSFAATTKSFVIDHPTKPNHKLRYGSLESPYHGIRLTGEAEVVDGICTVKLPDYIHALCHQEGAQVQLTNIKHGKVLWVDKIDIDNNEFTVATETNGNYKFYWSFTAIRKDIEDMVVEFENNEKE